MPKITWNPRHSPIFNRILSINLEGSYEAKAVIEVNNTYGLLQFPFQAVTSLSKALNSFLIIVSTILYNRK